MRQFAASVGVSNPYLSQIERGLRAPSDAARAAFAESLETSTERLHAEAGFVAPPPDDEADRTLYRTIDARAYCAASPVLALFTARWRPSYSPAHANDRHGGHASGHQRD